MSARAELARHPALVELRLRRPILRPDALRFSEAALGILNVAGMPLPEAARCFRLLFTYTLGFLALSPAERFPTARAEARAALSALDPAAFPNLTAAADAAVEAMGGDEQFLHGLELILDAIATRLP